MPTSNIITVLTVNWYSSDLLAKLFHNLLAKADDPERIQFLIVDNSSGRDNDLEQLKEVFSQHQLTILSNTATYKISSQNHASGLNKGFRSVQTGYTLLIDPDVYVFKKSWDSFFTDLLTTTNALGVGTTYPAWQLGKYHNFPSPVFALFDTKRLTPLAPDWMCYNETKLKRFFNMACLLIVRGGYVVNRKRFIKYNFINNVFSLIERLLPVCSLETGWQLAANATRNACRTHLFSAVTQLSSTLTDCVPEDKRDALNELSTHYELYTFAGEVILTHRYSTNSGLWKTEKGPQKAYWETCINKIETD